MDDVEIDDVLVITYSFTEALTYDGTSPPTAFEIQDFITGLWVAGITAVQNDPEDLTVTFPIGTDIESNQPWRITTQPAGLSPLVIPQDGLIS